MPSSRGSSRARDQTHISCISCINRQILYHCTTWEATCLIPALNGNSGDRKAFQTLNYYEEEEILFLSEGCRFSVGFGPTQHWSSFTEVGLIGAHLPFRKGNVRNFTQLFLVLWFCLRDLHPTLQHSHYVLTAFDPVELVYGHSHHWLSPYFLLHTKFRDFILGK